MNKLTFLLLILFVFCFLFTFFHKEPPPKIANPLVQKELSKEEYLKVKNDLITIVNKENPRVALTKIREEIKTNAAIARSCHPLVHEIGRAAFEKYNDFGTAMQYQDEICNSGYLHGIIESNFAKSYDIFSAIQTICNKYNPKSYIGWECYHGVGHGLMFFTNNDLPKSLSYCEQYTDFNKHFACSNGVFMENFNVDQKIHISKYINIHDPFYPCKEQKTDYKQDCYSYAPTYYLNLHKNQYQQALQWCKTAEMNYQSACVAGIGSQAIKENINNPKFVETICMQDKKTTVYCINGMIDLYTNHFGRTNEAEALCKIMEKETKPICERSVTLKRKLFQTF